MPLRPIRDVLTPLHIRLAMAAFTMTNRDLAPHIEVFESTIANVLKGKASVKSDTIYRIAAYFEARGVEFIYDDEAPGVRVRLAVETRAAE